MKKKLVSKIIYVIASLIIVIGQLEIIQVFADTTTSNLTISTIESELKKDEEFILDVHGTKEQLAKFNLVKDSSFTEVKRTDLGETQLKIYLKGNKLGTFDFSGKSGGVTTNTLSLTVTDSLSTSSTDQRKSSSVLSSETATLSSNSTTSKIKGENTTTTKSSVLKDIGTNSEITPSSDKKTTEAKKAPKAAGDDPGISITSSSPITSKSQVELTVKVWGSAGEYTEDGMVHVVIPKSIVDDPKDLKDKIVIGDPFYLADPAYIDDGNGNYVLNINYDHTKIDPSGTFGATITIKFDAPEFHDNTNVPDHINFDTDLEQGSKGVVSTDTSSSETRPSQGGLPSFTKYGTGHPTNINGRDVILLDPDVSSNNTFVIIVNYNKQALDNVSVTDDLPADTKLSDPNSTLASHTTGDGTPYDHLKIFKVTNRKPDGQAEHFQYVTSNFKDKISITDHSLKVDFGDIGADDAYVVTYGMEVDPAISPSDFGIRYNHAKEFSNGNKLHEMNVPVKLDEDNYQSVSLIKKVDQETLATKSGDITYDLTFKDAQGTIKAGTIISDPLPAHTKYIGDVSLDATYLSPGDYDPGTNTVKYKLLKDLNSGNLTTVKFKVHYENKDAKPGDTIINKASFVYGGSNVYSNDATTTLNGSAYIYKKDSANKNPLAGAVFKITNENGNTVVDNLISDSNGYINSGLLESGKYNFIETQAPKNYQLDSTPITFEVKEGQTTPVSLDALNTLTPGGVVLTKTDINSGESLQGAVFELQNQSGKKLQSGLTTDEFGKLAVDNLIPGNYQFIETKAPTGYELDKKPVLFTIEKGQREAVQVFMTNRLIPGGVVLTKKDAKTGEHLQGAVFELQNSAGKTIQSSLITDKSGRIQEKNLTPGNYQFIETQAPTGYSLNKTPIKFSIVKDQSVAVQMDVTNKLMTGGAVLTKTDVITGERLQGAVFKLQNRTGKTIQSGLSTDESGKLAVNDLNPGDYQFIETQAPIGYELDKTPVKFTIEKGQEEAVQVSMTNKLISRGVVLTKTDAKTGEHIQGAVFKLLNGTGKTIQSGLRTDKSGKLAVNDLTPGDYQFIETQAPTGYDLDKTPVPFAIQKDQQHVVEVFKTNKEIVGSIVLNKVDSVTGQKLAGAVFELRDKGNKLILKNLTTNSFGKLAINDLLPGKYSLIETKAPKGYLLDATPIEFSINGNETNQKEVTKANKEKTNSVRLEKKESQTGKLLQGAIFKLVDNKGKTLKNNLVSDKNGVVLVNGLQRGRYSLSEIHAPKGYELDDTPVNFVILENSTAVNLVKLNRPKAIKELDSTSKEKNTKAIVRADSLKSYPKTGEKSSVWMIIVGLAIVIFSITFLYWKKKK